MIIYDFCFKKALAAQYFPQNMLTSFIASAKNSTIIAKV